MQIKWLKIALEDLDDIAEYIKKENPIAAEKIVKIIWERVYKLGKHPNSGRPGRVKETRELVIENLPFIVPYRIKKNIIEILRVLHTSRNWPDSFK